jgi:DNA-binding response OmpR family regulator
MSELGRILVVDDNRMNRLTLGHSLEQQGYNVSAAEDGYQALEMLRSQPFDLILLDIVMPGLDGFQVLEQIKEEKTLKVIPVIVISALDEIESAVRCIEMGAEDYLPKPFNPVLLRARLGASLEKKKLRDLEQAYLQQEVMLRENERLTALGRLSVGMAHELNNPAAALRGTEQLKAHLHDLQAAQAKLTAFDLTGEQQLLLTTLSQQAQERAAVPLKLDPLTSSDEEARLEAFLDENGISESWELAPALVQLGCGANDLLSLMKHFSSPQLAAVLSWWARTYTVYSMQHSGNRQSGR